MKITSKHGQHPWHMYDSDGNIPQEAQMISFSQIDPNILELHTQSKQILEQGTFIKHFK